MKKLFTTIENKLSADGLFLIYLISMVLTHGDISEISKIGIVFLSIAMLGKSKINDHVLAWLGISLLLGSSLITNYFQSANHVFLTFYLSLFFLLQESGIKALFADSYPKFLIIFVIMAAIIQKFTSPYFMNGNMLASYILNGDSLSFVSEFFFTDLSTSIDSYRLTLANSINQLGIPSSLVLSTGTIDFKLYAKSLSMFILLFEIILALAFIPKQARITYYIAILFIWGTFLVRPEASFLALLSILSILTIKDLSTIKKRSLQITSVVLILASLFQI
ncbi:MAG: hypothetical protein HRT71_17415 [Flavobacteriales bacterium]|nr:hypothetical protein [Flavobacteriales bacterium]